MRLHIHEWTIKCDLVRGHKIDQENVIKLGMIKAN